MSRPRIHTLAAAPYRSFRYVALPIILSLRQEVTEFRIRADIKIHSYPPL